MGSRKTLADPAKQGQMQETESALFSPSCCLCSAAEENTEHGQAITNLVTPSWTQKPLGIKLSYSSNL